MSVGETCVKCGDISCCWICVSLTLRKWRVPACSLSDRRVYPASQTRSQSQSHTNTRARTHTHTQLHHVIDTTQTTHSVHTVNMYVSLGMAGPDPKDWFSLQRACVNIPLMHSRTPHAHGSTSTKGLRVRVRQHGYSQVSLTIDDKLHKIIQYTTSFSCCHIKTTPKTRECIYAPSSTSLIFIFLL